MRYAHLLLSWHRWNLRRSLSVASGLALGLFLLAAGAAAQEAGRVVSVEPTAEIGRDGVWAPATPGDAIQEGDTIRTGRPGRLSIAFQDESVVNLAEDSELIIDEQIFDPSRGVVRTLLQLVQGKVRALVSSYYEQRTSRFEVRTPTALAGVRGTDFIVVHDPLTEVTELVGVSGRVEVHSAQFPTGRSVFVGAQEITVVARSKWPSPPRRLQEGIFKQYIEGLQFIGVGRVEGLPFGAALVKGNTVPTEDRAEKQPLPSLATSQALVPQPGSPAYGTPNASNLIGQSPAVINAGAQLGIEF